MFVLVFDSAANDASLHVDEIIASGGTIVGVVNTFCDLPCERPRMAAATQYNARGSSVPLSNDRVVSRDATGIALIVGTNNVAEPSTWLLAGSMVVRLSQIFG